VWKIKQKSGYDFVKNSMGWWVRVGAWDMSLKVVLSGHILGFGTTYLKCRKQSKKLRFYPDF